jgi:hypothetical protein
VVAESSVSASDLAGLEALVQAAAREMSGNEERTSVI